MILEKGRIKFQSDNIDEAIDIYIGKNKNDDIKLCWNNDGSIKNPYFTPKNIMIINEAGYTLSGELDYNSSYKIILKADIEEMLSNIDFWILIYRDNNCIFALKGMNDNLHIGENIFEFLIYPRMIPPGKCDISLSISIKNLSWIVNPDDHIASIYFSVASTNKNLWEGKQIK